MRLSALHPPLDQGRDVASPGRGTRRGNEFGCLTSLDVSPGRFNVVRNGTGGSRPNPADKVVPTNAAANALAAEHRFAVNLPHIEGPLRVGLER